MKKVTVKKETKETKALVLPSYLPDAIQNKKSITVLRESQMGDSCIVVYANQYKNEDWVHTRKLWLPPNESKMAFSREGVGLSVPEAKVWVTALQKAINAIEG